MNRRMNPRYWDDSPEDGSFIQTGTRPTRRQMAEIAAGVEDVGALMRQTLKGKKTMAATKKKACVVKFSKGITVSKNYQSVKYEVGIEMPFEIGSPADFTAAVAQLEEACNGELKRLKDAIEPPKPKDFFGLDR